MAQETVLLVDTDGGVDDVLALMMLLGAEKPIHAITTSFGNVGLQQATQNILDTLAVCSASIPVYKGAAKPHVGEAINAVNFHGPDGLGMVTRPENFLKAEAETAQVLLRRLLRKALSGGPKLQLLTLGPLTNLASVLEEEPAFVSGIDRIWVMGGTCQGRGNVTPAAEFNIYCDPEAAQTVFGSGVNITVMPWEPALKYAIHGKDVDAIFSRLPQSPVRKFAEHLCAFMRGKGQAVYQEDVLILPDPLAAAVLLEAEVAARIIVSGVLVETGGRYSRGATIVDLRGKTSAPILGIVEGIDRSRWEKLFEQTLKALC